MFCFKTAVLPAVMPTADTNLRMFVNNIYKGESSALNILVNAFPQEKKKNDSESLKRAIFFYIDEWKYGIEHKKQLLKSVNIVMSNDKNSNSTILIR